MTDAWPAVCITASLLKEECIRSLQISRRSSARDSCLVLLRTICEDRQPGLANSDPKC